METQFFYKRFKNCKLHHFTPALGYNCPFFADHPDYEVVKIIKAPKGHSLKNRRVLIAWGAKKALSENAVFAEDIDKIVAGKQQIIAVAC